MAWWFRQKLYTQIFICMCVGVLLGLAFKDRYAVIAPEGGLDVFTQALMMVMKSAGDIFIRLLLMMVVPLTCLTLVAGLTKLDGIKSLRSLGGQTILVYIIFAFIATGIGMTLALVMRLGAGMTHQAATGAATKVVPLNFLQSLGNFLDGLVQWVPKNPVEAFASTDTLLQVIFFSIVVGIGLLILGKKAERLVTLINDGADLMICVTEMVIQLAPYGILALITHMTATLQANMLGEVGKLILAQQFAVVALIVAVYPLAIRFVARLSPWQFYRNVSPAMLVAASTTSSAATLPVSMEVAQDKIGAPENVWGFMLSLGATVGKEGMASCLGVIGIFACNLYGVQLTPGQLLQILFLGSILSICTPGTKGGGIVTSTILLQALHVPTEVIIPILVLIWPILDIGNTCCNVTGDLMATTLLASYRGVLDREVYFGRSKRANAI